MQLHRLRIEEFGAGLAEHLPLSSSFRLVQIRLATPEDIPEMMRLSQQSASAAHWSAREYEALFAPDAPKRVALIASGTDSPSGMHGFVIARCDLDAWEIENVVVSEQHRRKEIGQNLVRELLNLGKMQAAESVMLEVRESNRAARRLYEKLGFIEDGRRRGYYRDPGEDAVLLRHRFTDL